MEKMNQNQDKVMSNDYNMNSEPQLCAMKVALQILEKNVFVLNEISQFMTLLTEKHQNTLRMSDYGCSTGRNSLSFVDLLHEVMMKVFQVRFTVHSFLLDLPENNFNEVLRIYKENEGCKNEDNYQHYVSVGIGDLYRQSLPSRSVSFTCTFASLHWLSDFSSRHYEGFKDPQCCAVSCASDENDQDLVQRLLNHSREDLRNYLLARKEEVEVGGLVVFSCLGYGPHILPTTNDEEYSYEKSKAELNVEGSSNTKSLFLQHRSTMPGAHRIFKEMGKLLLTTKERFEMTQEGSSLSMRFLPIVPRAKKDVIDILHSHNDLQSSFNILYNEVHENIDPIWEKLLLRQYSEEEYVDKEVGFIRAWSESCIKEMLHFNEDALKWFYDEMKRLVHENKAAWALDNTYLITCLQRI